MTISIITLAWFFVSKTVWGDYQDLLNNKEQVQLSLITLLVPIGCFLPMVISIILFFIAIYTGKQARLVIGEKWTNSINKMCVYSALLGVVSSVAFALYSMNLLDEYGYKYSYELTNITPTGIHLMYVKTQ
ncbi:hypothetical protein [Aliivibrio salmonicida]|uniref:hypothetical protein n=1 Tax=Aliivibrio salmonicida TaxID=40269 RepID=UPI003D10166B